MVREEAGNLPTDGGLHAPSGDAAEPVAHDFADAPDLDQALEAVRRVADAPVVRQLAPPVATAEQLVNEAACLADDRKAYALLNAAPRKLSMEQRRMLPMKIRSAPRFARIRRFIELAASFEQAIKYSDQKLSEMAQPTQIAL